MGGALGTMEFWGREAGPLLEAFAARLGLGVPTISWITSRDRPAEFASLLAMAATTIAKIGNEIMELQRLELGEVREPFIPGTVGSITMPQKRNPEFSEHLDTLARLVRSQAAVMTEAMIQLHERDGRSWKAEWVALPEACAMTLAATGFAAVLLEGLEVDAVRMMENIDARRGWVFAEPVMRALADRVGKHTAHDVVYEASMKGVESGMGLVDALLADPRVTAHLDRSGDRETSSTWTGSWERARTWWTGCWEPLIDRPDRRGYPAHSPGGGAPAVGVPGRPRCGSSGTI